MRTRTRSRSANRGATEHSVTEQISSIRYESPWPSFDSRRIGEVEDALRNTAVAPWSFEEFSSYTLEATLGALEHGNVGRSISSLLSTIARTVTAMEYSRRENYYSEDPIIEPYLQKIAWCSQKIIFKKPPGEQNAMLMNLYDFFRNRLDDAAIRILRKDAFDMDAPESSYNKRWREFTWIEREVMDSILRAFDDHIDARCKDIKERIGAAPTT